ncbi:hypothetical protein C1645_741700 [Glomus cerebriforme]|uniref:Uncharacterized protein n=1 Tax=Glomus cerebriforme TaxID=658196 RepID=A0A397SMU0_9GLOM|nr:hypothetical protein C1645_741700 [Glomus cerebriforme]
MLKEVCSQIAVDELDNRLAQISRFSDLKIFKNDLKNIKRFIADDFWNMMKVFLFIIKGIIIKHQESLSVVKAKKTDELLVKELITSWTTTFVKLFKDYFLSELHLPKLHNWYYHVIVTIKKYGVINDYIIETYESLHKDAIKKPYRLIIDINQKL